MFCLGKGEQTVAMLSFTHSIFSVIASRETTGLYVTGLYVLSCRDRLPTASLGIKGGKASIVNKSDKQNCQERAVFPLNGGFGGRCGGLATAPRALHGPTLYLHTDGDG